MRLSSSGYMSNSRLKVLAKNMSNVIRAQDGPRCVLLRVEAREPYWLTMDDTHTLVRTRELLVLGLEARVFDVGQYLVLR